MFEFLRPFFKQEKAMKEAPEIIVNKDESSSIPIPDDIFNGIIKTLTMNPRSWEEFNRPPFSVFPITLFHVKSGLHITSVYNDPQISEFKITPFQSARLNDSISKRLIILEENRIDEIRYGLGVPNEDKNNSK